MCNRRRWWTPLRHEDGRQLIENKDEGGEFPVLRRKV